jgi:hypothetical protein
MTCPIGCERRCEQLANPVKKHRDVLVPRH